MPAPAHRPQSSNPENSHITTITSQITAIRSQKSANWSRLPPLATRITTRPNRVTVRSNRKSRSLLPDYDNSFPHKRNFSAGVARKTGRAKHQNGCSMRFKYMKSRHISTSSTETGSHSSAPTAINSLKILDLNRFLENRFRRPT